MWADADPGEVRAVWGDALGIFEASDIKRALEAMVTSYRDFPPTLPQFCALCRDAKAARAQATARLSGPKTAMPEHVREQLHAFVTKHRIN